jgi:capsular exopolysaccharide synthesis family protein
MDLSPPENKAGSTQSRSSNRLHEGGALVTTKNGVLQSAESARPEILSPTPRPIDLLYALRRRWKWALGLGILSAALAVAVAWILIPVNYTATAWLRIAKERPKIMYDTETQDDLLSHRQAQATLLTSKFVLNAALRKPGIAQLPYIRDERDPITWLKRNVNVSFPGRSQILQIAMTGDDPNQLKRLVDAVKDAYMEEVVSVERESHLRRKRVLDLTYQRNLEQIKKKEHMVRELANQLGTPDSEAARVRELHALESLADLRKKVNSLKGTISGMERKVTLLKKRLGVEGEAEGENQEPDRELLAQRLLEAALAQDPVITQTYNQISALDSAIIEERLRAANDDAPSILRLKERQEALAKIIEQRREEVVPQLRDRIEEQIAAGVNFAPQTPQELIRSQIEDIQLQKSVLESELEVTMESFKEEAEEMEKFGSYSADLETEKMELERLKKLTSQMGNELQQWEIELSAAPRVTLLEAASVPRTSDIDKKYRKVAMIGFAAFGLAVAGVAAVDFFSRRVNSPTEVAYGLGVRVMGDVPLISSRIGRHRRTLNGAAPSPREGMLAESIDNIRTALLHRASAESIRSVMVTSSLEKEGKTTVATQLSASLARSGRRTLLIDGDLRRPTAHRLFELPVGPGLSELLRSEAELEEVLRPTRVAGLWMISAGKCDPDAVQSLAKNGLGEACEKMRAEFDFIVIDSGPILTDADALLFGQYSDAVILSVLRDVSRVPRVFEACERLRAVDMRLLGAVVNGMSMGRYYRSYYRPYTIRVESSS